MMWQLCPTSEFDAEMGRGWSGRWGRWGWGARRRAGVSEGEGAVVVGDAEVGEAHEVDGGGTGGTAGCRETPPSTNLI